MPAGETAVQQVTGAQPEAAQEQTTGPLTDEQIMGLPSSAEAAEGVEPAAEGKEAGEAGEAKGPTAGAAAVGEEAQARLGNNILDSAHFF